MFLFFLTNTELFWLHWCPPPPPTRPAACEPSYRQRHGLAYMRKFQFRSAQFFETEKRTEQRRASLCLSVLTRLHKARWVLSTASEVTFTMRSHGKFLLLSQTIMLLLHVTLKKVEIKNFKMFWQSFLNFICCIEFHVTWLFFLITD